MGKGIAVLFKKKFEGITELKNQKAKVGDIAVLSKGSCCLSLSLSFSLLPYV
jgi:hypothetical protein